MGKWKYQWEVTFYTSGLYLERKVIRAHTRQEAIKKLRETGVEIVEIYSCRRIDTW